MSSPRTLQGGEDIGTAALLAAGFDGAELDGAAHCSRSVLEAQPGRLQEGRGGCCERVSPLAAWVEADCCGAGC